jgi:copper chaperone CopZ
VERRRKVEWIVILTLIWSFALVIVHVYGDKPGGQVPPLVPGRGPHLTMHFNHLCCSGCGDSAFQEMKRFTWLGQPRVVMPQGAPQQMDKGLISPKEATNQANTAPQPAGTDYGRDVVADLHVVEASKDDFDFVRLRQATRDGGLVASRMEIAGIPHFLLMAYLPHMCCGLCQTAVEEALAPGNSTALASAQPMPGHGMSSMIGAKKVDIDFTHQVVTAEFRDRGDVGMLIEALEQAGFAPQWIHLKVLTS